MSPLLAQRARKTLAGLIAATLTMSAAGAVAPAQAAWRASSTTRTSLAYNNGIAFDAARDGFFFAGVSSTTNSGLYRTDSRLSVIRMNSALIPLTKEGYNHVGDLSFDPVRRRVLLPLECYYPASGGNTCGVGAIGVADPLTLRFLYYVNLDSAQIKKAMWAEISPDGRWIWSSSGTHLIVYDASQVTGQTAARQRAGSIGGIRARDLGAVLPTPSVTGATFYQDALTHEPRLLLALNRGTHSEVVSYATGTADRRPTIENDTPRTEITVPQSPLDNESEGLAETGAGRSVNPLGGVLHWLMLPAITQSSLYSRILSYEPVPAPPPDGATVPPGQRLPAVLARGLEVTVVCNHRCTSTAVATITATLARRVGLTAAARPTAYVVGAGSLPAGIGKRTLTITFRSQARRALRCLQRLPLAITARSTDASTRRRSPDRLFTTLRSVSRCPRTSQQPPGLG